MALNYWMVPRPKRRLTLMPDCLWQFAVMADGEEWRGNRDLQLLYEEALEDTDLKRIGLRRDQMGSGARTYAAWLFAYGLWFTDHAGVTRLTLAGEALVNRRELPVPLLTKQMITMQYPSSYSVKPGVRINRRFRIHPFRFLLELLLDERIDSLSKEEIARFVITEAETRADLDKVVDDIALYRMSGESGDFLTPGFEKRFASVSTLEDIANTLINNLEYTQLVYRPKQGGPMMLVPGKRGEVERWLEEYPTDFIPRPENEEYFQRRYGLDLEHEKDTRDFAGGSVVTAQDAQAKKVIWAYYELLSQKPLKSLDQEIFQRISEGTGVPARKVEGLIRSMRLQPSLEVFEERYLRLANSGRSGATEFEQATAGVFGEEGLGYAAFWIGNQPLHPDVLAIALGSDDAHLGIIDAKAYSDYSISNDHKNRMVHNYVPTFREHSYKGRVYTIAFFSYVAGGFKGTMRENLRATAQEANVPGSFIRAENLLVLLRQHQQSPMRRPELKALFASNREVLPSDFH